LNCHDDQYKYAQNPETRRRTREADEGRLEINAPILKRVLELRRKITKILGYPTWADYVTEEKMVKSAQAAFEVRSYRVYFLELLP
jgi:Zn-dependent oligopeptidase